MCSAVPSGESSSTNTTSHSMPCKTRSKRCTNSSILAFSLKVGTTMSNYKARDCIGLGMGFIFVTTINLQPNTPNIHPYQRRNTGNSSTPSQPQWWLWSIKLVGSLAANLGRPCTVQPTYPEKAGNQVRRPPPTRANTADGG